MFCQERVRLCLVLEVVYSAPLHSCPTGRRPQRTAGTYVEKYSNQHYIWTVDRRECASVFIYKHRLLFSLQHTPAMRKSYVQWASDYSLLGQRQDIILYPVYYPPKVSNCVLSAPVVYTSNEYFCSYGGHSERVPPTSNARRCGVLSSDMTTAGSSNQRPTTWPCALPSMRETYKGKTVIQGDESTPTRVYIL